MTAGAERRLAFGLSLLAVPAVYGVGVLPGLPWTPGASAAAPRLALAACLLVGAVPGVALWVTYAGPRAGAGTLEHSRVARWIWAYVLGAIACVTAMSLARLDYAGAQMVGGLFYASAWIWVEGRRRRLAAIADDGGRLSAAGRLWPVHWEFVPVATLWLLVVTVAWIDGALGSWPYPLVWLLGVVGAAVPGVYRGFLSHAPPRLRWLPAVAVLFWIGVLVMWVVDDPWLHLGYAAVAAVVLPAGLEIARRQLTKSSSA